MIGCLTQSIWTPRFKSSMSIDTKRQKGNFTHDEWNNLLRVFNISQCSLICCSQNFSFTSCTETMAKRMQEQEGEEGIVAKSKPTMNLAFTVSTSSTVQNLVASKSPGILRAPVKLIGQVLGNVEQENSIKTQRRVLKCGKKMQFWM